MKSQAGVSLLEILIAVCIVAIVVSTLSTLFPKASRSIVVNGQRLAATNLASSKIEDLKKLPYAYLDVSGAGFTGASALTCDCVTQDFTGFFDPDPTRTEEITSAGTIYTRKTCVTYVTYAAPNWISQCAPPLPDIYKNIHVHVSWISGTETLSVDQESSAISY